MGFVISNTKMERLQGLSRPKIWFHFHLSKDQIKHKIVSRNSPFVLIQPQGHVTMYHQTQFNRSVVHFDNPRNFLCTSCNNDLCWIINVSRSLTLVVTTINESEKLYTDFLVNVDQWIAVLVVLEMLEVLVRQFCAWPYNTNPFFLASVNTQDKYIKLHNRKKHIRIVWIAALILQKGNCYSLIVVPKIV